MAHPIHNQPKRNIQPTNNTPLSASPAQLSIPSNILPPSTYAHNPYNASPYSSSPSPFAFPSQPLQYPNPYQQQQLRHDSITQNQQQHHIPQSPNALRKRRESDINLNQPPGSSTSLGRFGVEQHGLYGSDSKISPDQSSYGIGGPSTGASGDTLGQSGEGSTPRPVKKGRTNTPWTPAEEQRLKLMRDAGNSWSEIAKTFPARTEGSVKKHWYKDMHYAEFAEDESQALLQAIKEYDASKWKVIGQKVGKPAKACEQYAKEHLGINK